MQKEESTGVAAPSGAGVVGGQEGVKKKKTLKVCSKQALYRAYFKYHTEKGVVPAMVDF